MIVEQFLAWMAFAGPEQRALAIGPLLRAFFRSDLGRGEREGIEALMTVLPDDEEPQVRLALAEALADEPAAPHAVVLALAQDLAPIAAVVVARSPVLIDAELVDIVALAEPEVQRAAAGRATVSPALAAALAEVGDPSALVVLLANRRAAVPHFSLERIVERAGDDADVRAALLARPGVPIAIRQALLDRLAAALQDLVLGRARMSEERVGSVTREAKDRATVALAATAAAHEMGALVAHLRATGQLTATLMLRAACAGNIRFLAEALASLAAVPPARVAALLAEGREAGFRALYRKVGLPDRAYPAFLAAVEVNRAMADDPDAARLDDHAFARRLIERVLERCGDRTDAEFQDLLVLLRRFAAEAAREAARSYVSRSLARPLALAPAEPANDDGPADWHDLIADEAAEPRPAPADVAEALERYVFPEEVDEHFELGEAFAGHASVYEGWTEDDDLAAAEEFYCAHGIKAA